MIDFSLVRAHRGSQHNGFEELVVQLERRRPPPGAKEFRRIEGAGGDGGVEALWLKLDGAAVGIQAKYFLRVRDIDWSQIDDSVLTTLEQHPEVDTYHVAFACDLTGKSGAKSQGRTGWATWDARVIKWTQAAKAKGLNVSFIAITASELTDWLLQPAAVGLARYWFGTHLLSPAWFADRVHHMSADLGARYSPEQHVAVDAAQVFDGVARSGSIRGRLERAVSATWKYHVTSHAFPSEIRRLAERANWALRSVHAIADASGAPASLAWDVAAWIKDVQTAANVLDELDQATSSPQLADATTDPSRDAQRLHQHYQRHGVHQLSEALRVLKRLLLSSALAADAHRVLLVTGVAGTGKTHLLAAEAHRAIEEGRPALLFLGQQFSQGHPWEQCQQSLGWTGCSRDEFFGALDAAGEAAGARVLILVDAVNEGAGANFWRGYLASFIASVTKYPNIALVVACRTEYVRFAIPQAVLDAYPHVELHGFATWQEQELAAVQYLDRRGIVRPAGPLLSPEFSHPLFLKAASDALLREGASAFPRGLRGALQILGFYLDSVGSDLMPAVAEPADLSRELRGSLVSIAREMAETKHDHVGRGRAELLVDQAFGSRIPPASMTWLEVLLRSGVIRLDPDPTASAELLSVPEDVVRIAFQRFQDHLIVQACLRPAVDGTRLFVKGGPFEWLLHGTTRYAWAGVFDALAIQLADKFGIELVDVLPGGQARWWSEWGVQQGFLESVRWRATKLSDGRSAFSQRSQELLNALDQSESLIGLLLEVAADPAHPWNADFLHRNLLSFGLNDRDARWSRVIALAAEDESHPIHRVLTWALGGRLDQAEHSMLRLMGITLSWLGASTSRHIRDTAPRGLTRILRHAPVLYSAVLHEMAGVDDPYVVERVLAAAYGTACHLKDDAALASMAVTTFELIFKNAQPPAHLLARDYALGILELAQARTVLPKNVDLEMARLPFHRSAIRIPSVGVLERLQARAGDDSIAWSCGQHGDFGCYEIQPAINHFSDTRLDAPPPLTRQNRADRFLAEVVRGNSGRTKAYEAWERARRQVYQTLFVPGRSGSPDRATLRGVVAEATALRDVFIALLTPAEQARHVTDMPDSFDGARWPPDPPTFNGPKARRWVAARAYRMGWTKERFGDDWTPAGHSRSRARIERVGKKYQWIALYELLAKLSDTHWLAGDGDREPQRYAYPTDIPFQRDIDPTLAAVADVSRPADETWWRVEFELSSLPNESLGAWVKQNDGWHVAEQAIFRTDAAGERWINLHSTQRVVERHSERDGVEREIAYRREAFQSIYCLLVKRKDLGRIFRSLSNAKKQDYFAWEPPKFSDGPYLGEYAWRATWPKSGWSGRHGWPAGADALNPVVEYLWEPHLDASRPDGAHHLMPSDGILGLLGLPPPHPLSPYITSDSSGRSVVVHWSDAQGNDVVSIRRATLERMLNEHELGCLWLVTAERSAWPAGNSAEAIRRWFGSLLAFDGRRVRRCDWEAPWGS